MDTFEEALKLGSNAPADPVSAAVDGFRQTGVVTNKQAADILMDSKALAALQAQGLDLKNATTAAARRNAVKEAVARLAQTQAAVDTGSLNEYDNGNDAPVYKPYYPGQDIQEFDHTLWEERKTKAAQEYGLIKEETEGVDSYVGGAAYEWNAVLRGDQNYERTQFYEYWIQQATAALKKFPQFEGRTYRNLTFDNQDVLNKFIEKHESGKTVTADSFLSSSKDPNGYVVSGDYVVHMVIDGISGRDISETFSIPGQQEIVYIPGTTLYITAVQIANDGNPLIYAKEVIDNGKNMEANPHRNGQGSTGTINERQTGNAEGKRHDLGRIYGNRGVEGNGSTRNARQVQQSGGSAGYGGVDSSESVGAAPEGFTGKQGYYDQLTDENSQPDRPGDVRPMEVLKTDRNGRRVTEFAANAYGAEVTSDRMADRIQELIDKGKLGFDTRSNPESIKRALNDIRKNGDEAVRSSITANVDNGRLQDGDIEKAMLLYTYYANQDTQASLDLASNMFVNLATMANMSGRNLQLFQMLRKMSPEGQMLTIQKSIDRYMKQLNKKSRNEYRGEQKLQKHPA